MSMKSLKKNIRDSLHSRLNNVGVLKFLHPLNGHQQNVSNQVKHQVMNQVSRQVLGNLSNVRIQLDIALLDNFSIYENKIYNST